MILKIANSPITLKSNCYNAVITITFGAFWDIVPIDFLMIDLTNYYRTLSEFTFPLQENSFVLNSQNGFTLKISNSNIILKEKE